MTGTLKAPLRVEFDYTRSLGTVLSAFMTGLRDRTVLGGRTADAVGDGRVVRLPDGLRDAVEALGAALR